MHTHRSYIVALHGLQEERVSRVLSYPDRCCRRCHQRMCCYGQGEEGVILLLSKKSDRLCTKVEDLSSHGVRGDTSAHIPTRRMQIYTIWTSTKLLWRWGLSWSKVLYEGKGTITYQPQPQQLLPLWS
eukprot:PhF_6_TR11551/c0_g1_i3/m.18563